MTRFEAVCQYQEYGYMNLEIGDRCGISNEEWLNINRSLFEEYKSLDVSDIEGRLMNYSPFSIEAVFFQRSVFAKGGDERDVEEYCDVVYLIVDIDTEDIDVETAFDMIQIGSADKYTEWDEIVLEQYIQERIDN